MKKLMLVILIMCALLTSCVDDSSIGIIGGADGPTAVFVSESRGSK